MTAMINQLEAGSAPLASLPFHIRQDPHLPHVSAHGASEGSVWGNSGFGCTALVHDPLFSHEYVILELVPALN